ncbi:MAG: hypothetical protein ACRD4F_00925 [Candidatus Angelobacter sp.]
MDRKTQHRRTGADLVLLFDGIAPVAAVPSNCPHVLVRIQQGHERENYSLGACPSNGE